jgi:hypothetical protein
MSQVWYVAEGWRLREVDMSAMVTVWFLVGEESRRLTMWWPRKPQPPKTRAGPVMLSVSMMGFSLDDIESTLISVKQRCQWHGISFFIPLFLCSTPQYLGTDPCKFAAQTRPNSG